MVVNAVYARHRSVVPYCSRVAPKLHRGIPSVKTSENGSYNQVGLPVGLASATGTASALSLTRARRTPIPSPGGPVDAETSAGVLARRSRLRSGDAMDARGQHPYHGSDCGAPSRAHTLKIPGIQLTAPKPSPVRQAVSIVPVVMRKMPGKRCSHGRLAAGTYCRELDSIAETPGTCAASPAE